MARFNGGWVKLYRSVMEGDIKDNPYLLALWSWLLAAATWKESKLLDGGQQRILPPGSVVFGMRELAETWDCSKSTISKWAHYLHDTQRITLDVRPRGCVATILNWDVYQGEDATEQPPSGHGAATEQPPSGHGAALSEEEKKVRKEERKKILPRLAQVWNQNRGALPEVRGCSGTRRKRAESRWREEPSAEYWATTVQRIARSPFCSGDNDRGWRADFDFLIQPETRHKVEEGKYDSRTGVRTAPVISDEEMQERNELERIRRNGLGASL